MAYALNIDLGTPDDGGFDNLLDDTDCSVVVLASEAGFPRAAVAGGHDLIALDRLEALYALRELAASAALS